MQNQITLLAREIRGGPPGAGVPSAGGAAFTSPSRCSMAPSTRPVKPMPQSARNARRWIRPQQEAAGDFLCGNMSSPSANGHEVIVIEEHLHQVLAGAQPGF